MGTLRALVRRHWPVVAAALVVVIILLLPEYRFGGTTDRPAVEIVRTLVGSPGIVLAVPLTTAIATAMVTRDARRAGAAP